MGKLIKVAAQSRTHNINFVVQGESGSATYDLAQVYKENQYMPERRSPESPPRGAAPDRRRRLSPAALGR